VSDDEFPDDIYSEGDEVPDDELFEAWAAMLTAHIEEATGEPDRVPRRATARLPVRGEGGRPGVGTASRRGPSGAHRLVPPLWSTSGPSTGADRVMATSP
jgi:hypothetical protein